MLTAGDYDQAAERIYRAAGYHTSEQAPALSLVERLLGDGSVRTVPAGVLKAEGSIARIGQNWRVYLAEDCRPDRRKFVLAHELSHWVLGPGTPEEQCDRLAAALILPRPAFFAALRDRRPSLKVARRFGVDHSCAWLRYAETTGSPLALVTEQTVRTRGAAYSWPAEEVLRRMAEVQRPKGLRRCRTFDDPTRTVLITA